VAAILEVTLPWQTFLAAMNASHLTLEQKHAQMAQSETQQQGQPKTAAAAAK
jgi:hypothetical protein